MTAPIIAGTDPGRPEEAPLAFAAEFARVVGAPLWVVAVVTADGLGAVPVRELARSRFTAAAEAVDARAVEVGAEPRVVSARSAASGLHELAREEAASLLVVGSTHRGRLGRIVPGAVTDRLLHGSPCPVAIVPRGYRLDRPLRRIGVAFDGWPEATAAVGVARELAERGGLRVQVLTVMESGAQPTTPGGPAPDPAERREERAEAVLKLGMELLPKDLREEGRVLEGAPAEALAEAAEQLDLLVCGSRSYGPARTVLLGSVSHAVLHESSRPLLVVPRGAGAKAPPNA